MSEDLEKRFLSGLAIVPDKTTKKRIDTNGVSVLGEKTRPRGKVDTTADSIAHAKRRAKRASLALGFSYKGFAVVAMISPRLAIPARKALE